MWRPTYQTDYLMHHGILGQKWGVRRYQNPDGSLTAAGRKHLGVQEAASHYAKKKAKSEKENAKYYEDTNKSIQKRYGSENGHEKWAQDMYGKNWKNERILQDDMKSYGYKSLKEMANADIKDMMSDNSRMAKHYQDEAQKWIDKSEKLMNTPVGQLSKSEFKEAQKYAKKAMKEGFVPTKTEQKIKKPVGTLQEKPQTYNPKTGKMEDTKKSQRVSTLSGANKAKADLIYMQSKANAERTASQKSKKSSVDSSSLTGRFNSAKKDLPNLSYDKIYKEMKVNMNSEDPSVYKKAEDEWLKKHGY